MMDMCFAITHTEARNQLVKKGISWESESLKEGIATFKQGPNIIAVHDDKLNILFIDMNVIVKDDNNE